MGMRLDGHAAVVAQWFLILVSGVLVAGISIGSNIARRAYVAMMLLCALSIVLYLSLVNWDVPWVVLVLVVVFLLGNSLPLIVYESYFRRR